MGPSIFGLENCGFEHMFFGCCWCFPSYPLVNCHITMENHHYKYLCHYHKVNITLQISGWGLTYPSEKWRNSSVGMMTFPIWWEKNHVPNHQPVFECCLCFQCVCVCACVWIYLEIDRYIHFIAWHYALHYTALNYIASLLYITIHSISFPFLFHSTTSHAHVYTQSIYIYIYTTSMHIWWYCIIYMSNKEYIRSNKHHSALQHSLWWLWDCSNTSAYHPLMEQHRQG